MRLKLRSIPFSCRLKPIPLYGWLGYDETSRTLSDLVHFSQNIFDRLLLPFFRVFCSISQCRGHQPPCLFHPLSPGDWQVWRLSWQIMPSRWDLTPPLGSGLVPCRPSSRKITNIIDLWKKDYKQMLTRRLMVKFSPLFFHFWGKWGGEKGRKHVHQNEKIPYRNNKDFLSLKRFFSIFF